MFLNLLGRRNQEPKNEPKVEPKEVQEDAEKRYHKLYKENEKKLYEICDRIRSNPKKGTIVVVQTKNIFRSDRARKMEYHFAATILRLSNERWIKGYDGAVYAFYKPTQRDVTSTFEKPLAEISKMDCSIHRVRYYSE